MRYFFNCYAVIVTVSLILVGPAALADEEFVSSQVRIKANPTIVWEAIHDERAGIPFHRRVIASRPSSFTIEETYSNLPAIGTAKCVLVENEVPGKSVDFDLVSSDKLKEFKGLWTLIPENDGRETDLRLTTHCDTGLNLPFARKITNYTVMKNIKLQLETIKELSENAHLKGAVS